MKLKMVKEKKTTSSSRPKKSKLSEDVRTSSNLWSSSRRLAHHFDFSSIVDDPIEIEEVEDPYEDNEQGWTCGEETLSKDNSKDTSSAPNETETTEGSLDERATTFREGLYECTSQPTPSPVRSTSSSFSCIFLFFALYFLVCRFHRDQLSR